MAAPEIVLGIDLGTTYSAMAYVDQYGKPRIIVSSEGAPTTPSVVYFYDADALVVGSEAVKMVVADTSNIARFIKRSMGEEDFSLEYFRQGYTPQELSAIILRKLKIDAEEALGVPCDKAVITVPAYFNSTQRGATAEAGIVAGLEVLSIINEPTAAAIAYGMNRLGKDQSFMVFDLGGGTFDVTVMRIEGRSLRTVATDGNAELGGKDWDDRLVSYVAEQFAARFRVDPRDHPQPYQELYERCLAVKVALSSQQRAVIPVNYRGKRMAVPITAERFTALCHDLVEQCSDTCNLVLEKARMSWRDIDDIVLVGGSTRMPMVRHELGRLWGRAPNREMNPDECVALGAALAAVFRHQPDHPALQGSLHIPDESNGQQAAPTQPTSGPAPAAPSDDGRSGEAGGEPDVAQGHVTSRLPEMSVTDVATHPLGIIVLDSNLRERTVELIPEGTPLPTEKRGRFAYAYDNMTAVRVEITEGHGATRDEVTVIGEVILDHLPPRPRGTPIDVIYRYNTNQILEVDIIDVGTGASRSATRSIRGSLSEEKLRAARLLLERSQIV